MNLESTYFPLCACFALIDINQNGAHDDEHRDKKLHISAVRGNTRNLTTEVEMYSLMLFIYIGGSIEIDIHVMCIIL